MCVHVWCVCVLKLVLCNSNSIASVLVTRTVYVSGDRDIA